MVPPTYLPHQLTSSCHFFQFTLNVWSCILVKTFGVKSSAKGMGFFFCLEQLTVVLFFLLCDINNCCYFQAACHSHLCYKELWFFFLIFIFKILVVLKATRDHLPCLLESGIKIKGNRLFAQVQRRYIAYKIFYSNLHGLTLLNPQWRST